MSKEITIYDIAKELSLSASTVSRALKNNPIINEETRKKVQKFAQEAGYRSNTFASNLRTQKTNTIGVIIPKLDSSFMSACLAGMEEVANENDYTLIITQSHESVYKEAQNANTLFNKRVDGVIASLTVEDKSIDHFNCFEDKQVPLVFFDRVPNQSNNACFVIDNFQSAYQATEHLIEQGCKRIRHYSMKCELNVYKDRVNGFNAAIAASEQVSGDVVYLESLNLRSSDDYVESIIRDEIDGVFVANDMAAVGCLLSLQEKGIKVPEDVAVVGFNNDPVSTIVKPELTTINYPGKEAGILAAKNLIEHLQGKNSLDHTNRIVLNSSLIVRDSSKKIKQ